MCHMRSRARGRARVAGRGRGAYVSFARWRVGANEHMIAFDSGETVAVKLQGDVGWAVESAEEWAVKEAEMDAMDPVRPLSITVTTIFGHATKLEVWASQTIGAVKAMIEEKEGVPVARQRLVVRNQPQDLSLIHI